MYDLQKPIGGEGHPSGDILVALTVNGTGRTLSLDARTSLLDALREHLNLTGTKKGCDHGAESDARRTGFRRKADSNPMIADSR
jgi:hypothetical protein